MFISILYMFRAAMCPSSGESIVSIRHLEYVTLCSIQTCTPNGHLYTVTYTRCRIDTINSPDDGHMAAPKHVENRNKHTWKKELCVKLVIYKEWLREFQVFKEGSVCIGELVIYYNTGKFLSAFPKIAKNLLLASSCVCLSVRPRGKTRPDFHEISYLSTF